MSKKSSIGSRGKLRPSRTATVVKQAVVPPANAAIVQQMGQQWGQTSYGPNAPILPYPGLQSPYGPRQFAYPIATNLNLVVRDNLTPFEILRQFADLYDVIRLCLQSWFDCAANLELDFVPVDGLLGPNETADKYQSDIDGYKEFFESPDRQHTLHEWLNALLEDLAVIDAVAIYPRRTYSGDLYALDLIDGATIKPMLDDRGRAPTPPFYAYEQILYGAPSELFTTDDLIYLQEHYRTKSAFGFSRVENIIMRVNQALRKQNLDMALFTDGNIPAGFISPAADVGWSPEQLVSYQTMLDNLLSGNDALRSRMKTLPPGSVFTASNPTAVNMDLDLFTLKVTHASFGVMPSQSGFTDDVNRATAESQDDITYQRTLKPIAKRLAKLFTFVLVKFFNEKRFKAVWKGYEEKDDFSAMVADHVSLVGAGIERADAAATALKLGDQGPEIPRFIMTKTGPFVVDDLANKDVRSAQVDALIAPPPPPTMQSSPDDNAPGGEEDDDEEEQGEKEKTSPAQNGKGKNALPAKESKATSSPAKNNDKAVKRVAGGDAEEEEYSTAMVAFFLDAHSAEMLALPGGESVDTLHITLTLGDIAAWRENMAQVQSVLMSVAATAKPLVGRVSGVGRFTPSDSSDGMSPIIAMIDIKGLQQFRAELASRLTEAGLPVTDDFAYMPHCTLAYIDADAPIPIKNVPEVPLTFVSIWLVAGSDRTEYLFTGEEVAQLVRADLRKWRDVAISRMQKGKSPRTFQSTYIPQALTHYLDAALTRCRTPEHIRSLFYEVQESDDGSFFA